MHRRFDFSGIAAPTVQAFRSEFSSRVAAAGPTETDKAACSKARAASPSATASVATPAPLESAPAAAQKPRAPSSAVRSSRALAAPAEAGEADRKVSDVIHRDFPDIN
jgi:hypothetical protein